MGNCIALQQKIVKVMTTDGRVLEYKAPIKAYQILSEYAGHTISEEIPVVHHLSPDVQLLDGHLYYLLPGPAPPPKADEELIKLPSPIVEAGQGPGVVRIKLVISKQELQAMLSKGGLPVNNIVPRELWDQQSSIRLHNFDSDAELGCKGWKPLLESIPEVN